METTAQMDVTLGSLKRAAHMTIAAARNAYVLPHNAALWDEIQATSAVATELLAYAEVGQWASVESEKRAALDRAIELARKLEASTRWMTIDLAFLHSTSAKQ
jgi:hypothetical protein